MSSACQICERDWQPSTVTDEPLIQLARGDARNATTSPTSSARPKRPNGSSARTNSAMPAGSACLPLLPRASGKKNRSRRNAVDANAVFGELLRHRLCQADFGGLHRVVDHASARSRPQIDAIITIEPPPRGAHVRHDEARHADCRVESLIESLLPFGIRRVDDIGAFGGADVVDQDVDAAERLDSRADDFLRPFAGGRSAATAMRV